MSRYLFNLIKSYIIAINRIFRYLAYIRDIILIFGGNVASIIDYNDADYIGNYLNIYRLMSGYSFFVDSGLIN